MCANAAGSLTYLDISDIPAAGSDVVAAVFSKCTHLQNSNISGLERVGSAAFKIFKAGEVCDAMFTIAFACADPAHCMHSQLIVVVRTTAVHAVRHASLLFLLELCMIR